jgi:metallo-beta-lactamase family protein
MIQGGRVEYHVQQNIENPYATILMIGYATEGTIGHKLITGEVKELKISGQKKEVRATIKKIDVFSGHGDLNDLITFVSSQDKQTLKKIFLVHGELESMYNFKAKLEQEGYSNIEIPEFKQTFELN